MRLEVTRRSDVAVRVLVSLGTEPRRFTAAELGGRIDASARFVPHAVGPLVDAGWVRSDPGPTGGYRLVVPLGSISVRDVIEAVEGPIDDGRCVVAKRPCAESAACALHAAWTQARHHLIDVLDSTSIASVGGGRPDGEPTGAVRARGSAGRT